MLKEGQFRNPSGCAIAAMISKDGKRFSGEKIVDAMRTMHDRSNGLGGGFAGYGIYPEYADYYALHIFYDNETSKNMCEDYISRMFEIVSYSIIPTRKHEAIKNKPLIWRYFASPNLNRLKDSELDEMEYVARIVTYINTEIDGAYVFSSGKNMGVFKAVGFPEDVGEFFMLDTYEGYMWTAHGRYPTNTPGWWAGSHPFALLDYSIVHNGEISSYDANRRYMEMFGYKCNLQTDTEVMCYIIDFLLRREHLTLEEVASVMAAPFWDEIDRMPADLKEKYTFLRNTYASLLVTGPFSIIVGFDGGLMALNDRLKLRSLVVGYKDDMVYFGSEECAIRSMEPNLDSVYSPRGGEPVIVTVRKED